MYVKKLSVDKAETRAEMKKTNATHGMKVGCIAYHAVLAEWKRFVQQAVLFNNMPLDAKFSLP